MTHVTPAQARSSLADLNWYARAYPGAKPLYDTLTTFIQQYEQMEAVKCPTEYAHTFFVYDFMPQKIMFKSDRGDDTMALDVLSVRGWGHLIGHGQAGLKINEKAAAAIQDNFGKWVAETLNAELRRAAAATKGE